MIQTRNIGQSGAILLPYLVSSLPFTYTTILGDEVLIRNARRDDRKGGNWSDKYMGPYKVVEVSGSSCYVAGAKGKQLKTAFPLANAKIYTRSTTTQEVNSSPVPPTNVLSTLQDGEWLSDEVIDAAMAVLKVTEATLFSNYTASPLV
jgi:hypothetical protein